MNIKTKYGNARIDNGYYRISSNEYGFKGHQLHRLIMADTIGCGIHSNYDVHHIDGNKLNNNLDNLEILPHKEHLSLHKNHKNKNESLESCIKKSKAHSQTSNYFRVYKQNDSTCKQGFIWKYRYQDENGKEKAISSVDIKKLKKRVKAKSLPWMKL